MRNSSWAIGHGGSTGHFTQNTADGVAPEAAAPHTSDTASRASGQSNAAASLVGKNAVEPSAAETHNPAKSPRPDDPALRVSNRAERSAARSAPLIQAAAALIWLPQAALIAWAIGGIASGAPASSAFIPAAGVLALGVLRAGLDALGVRRAFQGARAVLGARRQAACDALAARSPIDINRPASGQAAAIIGEQAEAVQTYLARFQPARMKATVVPLVILVCVAPLSWVAALILLVAAPLIPVFMALIGWRAKAASEEQLVEMGAMNAFLLDRLRGLATIRTLGAVETTATRLRANAEAVRRKTMVVLRIAFLSSAVLELFSALGVALVAVYIGFHLLGELPFGAWGDKLTLTQGMFILLLAPTFFEPLRELSAVWHDKAAGQAAITALDSLSGSADAPKILSLPGASADSAITTTPPPIDLPTGALAVTANELCFRHPGAVNAALQSVVLDVKAGERIALLGPSGSGKSTLLALIAGLASPDAGVISIGGVELTDQVATAIRRRIAWIGQQPHIFAGAIMANVTLGRTLDGVDSSAAAKAALTWANLAPLHAARNGAVIGENGVGMSGGEALRLALARAAFNRDAGLVLADEPTAHLDRATALAVTDGLLELARGRTLIVATHDPELASKMDRIFTFKDASLDSQGRSPLYSLAGDAPESAVGSGACS